MSVPGSQAELGMGWSIEGQLPQTGRVLQGLPLRSCDAWMTRVSIWDGLASAYSMEPWLVNVQ